MDNKIYFVDQTLRDAQQSLWGYTMRTDMITPIAETMDRVGYRDIATVGFRRSRSRYATSTKTPGRGQEYFQSS